MACLAVSLHAHRPDLLYPMAAGRKASTACVTMGHVHLSTAGHCLPPGFTDLSAGSQHMHFGDDGDPLDPVPQAAVFVVDDWLQLRAPLQVVAALACLRQRLAQAFAAKVG